ncbi:FAD-dependent oxidoreductase [Streptomyces zagrosensis]|uniref:Putative NAD/FAD-binding protein n=1 Tax=Streptomyces zagrosensis TaxID=1042984 RepID=A0A7W9QA35_9ACTN|nr:FAD-dependent oxidoreductase [Streptomyces zagrosensis]MBB5936415.1 putative NAD/FAD-binding protein [Streptomyces zagrosensis]
MRIGIVGAGTAGLATAWLLSGSHEIVLMEERDTPGGDARTISAHTGGDTCPVDLGVHGVSDQFPLWSRLMRSAGFGPDDLLPVPASRTLLHHDQERPYLVSPHTPQADRDREVILGPPWEALKSLSLEATRWEDEELHGEMTVEEAANWPQPHEALREEVMHALPASVFGCTTHDVAHLSARGVGGFFAAPQPSILEAAPAQHLRGGTQRLALALVDQLRTTEVRLRARLHRLERHGDRFTMIETSGHTHVVDAVIFAIPAYAAAAALQSLGGSTRLRTVLGAFTYQTIDYAAHLDPFGMPEDRKHWSTTNVTVHNGWSETTTWYGPGHDTDVFVSQFTHRRSRPDRQIARTSFRTPLPTPAAHCARRRLEQCQGEGGLYFAGAYTRTLNSQESAVASAVDLARRLTHANDRMGQLTN